MFFFWAALFASHARNLKIALTEPLRDAVGITTRMAVYANLVLAPTAAIVLVEFVHPGTLDMAAMKNAHVEQYFAIQNMGVQTITDIKCTTTGCSSF